MKKRQIRGQTLVEYGMLVSLVAIIVIAILAVLGQKLHSYYKSTKGVAAAPAAIQEIAKKDWKILWRGESDHATHIVIEDDKKERKELRGMDPYEGYKTLVPGDRVGFLIHAPRFSTDNEMYWLDPVRR